jgi:nucleotide-binding universal stress UspA family protein
MATAPVVVGVDGSAGAMLAVDYAVHEAELRQRPLRVVCVANRDMRPEQVVREALDRIAARSSVPAAGEAVPGRPAPVLVRESRRAALLVLGCPGHGRLPGGVASGAGCPVLVVRGDGYAGRPVLVGVNGSAASDAAVGFAFEEAALRGTPVIALSAWTGPASTGPGDMLPLVYDPAVVAEQAAHALTESLAGVAGQVPGGRRGRAAGARASRAGPRRR